MTVEFTTRRPLVRQREDLRVASFFDAGGTADAALDRMRFRIAAVLALAACTASAEEMPWVYGLDVAASSKGVGEPAAPLEGDELEGCSVGASRTIELVADVMPPAGRETIIASFSGGIAVFDREDHLLAETRGYRCEGSADELDLVAVGSVYGKPTLAVVATTGGRRETSTFVGLYAIAPNAIEPVFTGAVEAQTDDTIERGTIVLLPGGLVYRSPGGNAHAWRRDEATGVYVPVVDEAPHDEHVSMR
jgi:hypothetical protein